MIRSAWSGTALWVAAWIGVVAVGGGLAWFAIDRAGREVNPAGGLPVTAPRTSTATTGPAPTGPEATGPPGPTGAPSARPTRTASPSVPVATSAPSVPRTSAPPPSSVTRTWSGSAGRVTASCTGTRQRFLGASPADGWVVERAEQGEVDVRFERGEARVRVRVDCVGGVPRFEVDDD